jgi:hypothetical protein
MQGLNSSFTYIRHCKKKETIQARYQEANTQTNVQGQLMKKMIRNNIARNFNNKKVSYHSVSTQYLGQRPKKTQEPTKITHKTPNLAIKPKDLMYAIV